MQLGRRQPLRPCDGSSRSRLLRPPRSSVATASPSTSNAEAQHEPRFKAHIDFKYIKDNVDALVKNAKDRSSNADPKLVAELYDRYVLLKMEADGIRAERNENSGAMKVHAKLGVCPCGHRFSGMK